MIDILVRDFSIITELEKSRRSDFLNTADDLRVYCCSRRILT